MGLFAEHLESQSKMVRRTRETDFGELQSVAKSVGRTRRWIPEFVYNDAQLRCVLMHATMGFCFRSKQAPPEVVNDLAKLKELAARQQAVRALCVDNAEMEHWNKMAQTIRAVDKAGGFMALIAAISFRAWRLCHHDKEIAAELGMTDTAVGGILRRLISYAQRLGFETYAQRKDMIRPDAQVELVLFLWKQNHTVGEIVKSLRCAPKFVRSVLRKNGVYVWRRHHGRAPKPTCPKCGSPYTKVKRQMICRTCTRAYLAKYQRERRRKLAEEAFFKTVAYG